MTMNLQPSGVPASAVKRISSHARYETILLLRNGEQALLTIIIPLFIVIALSKTTVLSLGNAAQGFARIQTVAPSVLALAILSSAFTAQAIAVGFDRRYGVLTHIGTTPLGRRGLVISKTLAVTFIAALQVLLISAVAALLGWKPQGSILLAVCLMVLGIAAFSGIALLMAGTLRAEATLAGANLLFLLLLLGGGTVISSEQWPGSLARTIEFLPTAALANGLRAILRDGSVPSLTQWLVLLVWAVIGIALASRFFKWD
jgi:ABC-2 type transport system permease protein